LPARRSLGVGGSDYQPFGKINYENELVDLKNDYKHTGKELDEENNLQYYGARYMDNQTARFASVDPAVITSPETFLHDPQQFNSYSYTRNNPVIFIDPTGRKLVIGGNMSQEFISNTFSALQTIYSGIQINQLDSGDYEITLQEKSFWEKTKDFFSPDTANERLLERVIKDDNTITIKSGEEGQYGATPDDKKNASNGKGTGGTIYLDPDLNDIPALNEYNSDTGEVNSVVPSIDIVLGHELIHGSHYQEGSRNVDAGQYRGLNGQLYSDSREEVRTVGLGHNRWFGLDVTENKLRDLRGFNLRNDY